MEKRFDESVVFSASGGDVRLLKELLILCKEEFPKQLTELGEAIAVSDAVRIKRAAHTICGSLGAVGSRAAAATAASIERLSSEGSSGGTAELFERLRGEVLEFLLAAGDFLGRTEA